MKTILLLFISLCITMMVQAQVSKTIEVTAGGLYTTLGGQSLVISLTLKGTIDARDFKTMRDDMPMLSTLDLRDVRILAYNGNEGTYPNFGNDYYYPVDELPIWSFFYWFKGMWTGKSHTNLTHLILPSSITSIGDKACYGCSGLTSITFPSDKIEVENLSVTSIGDEAFYGCSGLTSITFPSNNFEFGNNVFGHCGNLESIVINSHHPIFFGISIYDIFPGINQNKCKLYIPYGCSEIFSDDFSCFEITKIVEMPGFILSEKSASVKSKQGSTVEINISSNANWTISSDQPWLRVNPTSGTGDMTLTFTMEGNPVNAIRTARVTVSALGVNSQTITVTQEGAPVGLKELTENSTQFKCYPNPFTEDISIEIQNSEHAEITVDIYNLAGELIKNLTTNRKDENLDLKWNGINDSGQKVVPGVYICKVNNQSKQLIYQGK